MAGFVGIGINLRVLILNIEINVNPTTCQAADFQTMGSSRMQSRATLSTADRFPGPQEVLQCRVRTWLQLMGCALVLELGVLISEWAERCDKAEHDGAKCGL